MRKIVAYILLLLTIFWNTWIVNATTIWDGTKSELTQKVYETRTKVESKYLPVIDNFVERNQNNEELLNKIKTRIPAVKEKLSTISNTYNRQKLENIINYIEASINLALYIIENDITNKFKNITLSESEIDKVQDELVKIQLNLLENWVNKLEWLTEEFDKLSNYEEKWNLSVNLDVNNDAIWKIKASFDLNDYTSSNSNFDSQVKWKVKAIVDAVPKWEEAVKLELSSTVDMISKDGNMYLLLENLNISDDTIDDIKEKLEILEKIAQENWYVKFENPSNGNLITILNNLSPNAILRDWKVALSQPMFKPYKKEGDRYYLMPTKYSCDKLMETYNKFYPFIHETCSESQYNDMLEELAEFWEIYIELWTNTKFWFEMTTEETSLDEYQWYITFSDTEIKELSLTVIPDQEEYPNEWIWLNYIKNDKLDFKFYAEEWEIDYDLTSKLDTNNRFYQINYKWKTSNSRETITSFLTLENNTIDWWYVYKDDRGELTAKASWKTDSSNKLSSININYSWKDEDWKEVINWKLSYNNWNFSFIYNLAETRDNLSIEILWNWDTINKVLTSLNSNISFQTKTRIYNEETYRYEYTWETVELFKSNIKLENKVISWNTTIKETDWTEKMSIKHSGTYEKNYLVLNNSFDLKWDAMIFNSDAKSRDIQRIRDINSLRLAIEQVYQDSSEYPSIETFENWTEWTTWVLSYMEKIPEDPLGAVEIEGCKFWYFYKVWPDKNWIENNSFELYACLETDYYWEKIYKVWYGIVEGESSNLNNYTVWEEIEKEGEPIVVWNLNIKADTRDNNNNANIYFNLDINEVRNIEFELDNKSTIEYKDIEIQTPENATPIEDLIYGEL